MKFFILLSFVFLCERTFSQRSDDLNINTQISGIDSSNIFISSDHYIWCGSAIEGEDGKYYLFYSRWKHGKRTLDDDSLNFIFDGFRGWQKYSEIAIAISDSPEGPYRHLKTILKGDPARNSWDRFTFHNPQINYFNGNYYLYFISNNFNDNTHFTKPLSTEQLHWYKYNCSQKIGVASATSIKGFLENDFSKKTEYLVSPDSVRTWEVAVNPSVTEGPDNRYYMMYKSRKPDMGHMTFWIAVAPTPTGPFTHYSEVSTNEEMACEDPYLWYDKHRSRFYAIAKYFSRTGKLVDEFGALVLLTSIDGKNWEPAKNKLVSNKKIIWRNGTETKLAHLERPFLLFDRNGNMKTLFSAASVENPFIEKSSRVNPKNNTFNVHIPLQIKK